MSSFKEQYVVDIAIAVAVFAEIISGKITANESGSNIITNDIGSSQQIFKILFVRYNNKLII